MPIFGKGRSAKFDFYLLLHSLSPFPAAKSVYIQWQRGSAKRGQTRSVAASTDGSPWAAFQFDEAFSVPCSLTQDARGGPGFEKKWLILAIMDGDRSGRAAKEPLGRVVINLADYAAEDDRATMSFTVAVNKALTQDVVESKMLITLGCRTRGKPPMVLGGKQVSRGERDSATVSADNSDDDTDSVSSHTPSVSVPIARPGRGAVAAASAAVVAAGSRGPARTSSNAFGGSEFVAQPQQQQQQRAAATVPPPRGAPARLQAADSDADSEDAFLAQAVAALDSNEPIPVAPGPARQLSRGAERPELPKAPSIGRTIPPAPQPLPSRPSNRPMFALRPEGQAPEPPGPEPESPAAAAAAAAAAAQPPPFMTRSASRERTPSLPPFATRPPAFQQEPPPEPSVVLDRPERSGSQRQLDTLTPQRAGSGGGSGGGGGGAEPRLVLQAGAVSIGRRPLVSVPPDDAPPALHSPVQASAPGRHWLDEPEDLGVDPSPPESPAVPAFQAVKPLPLSRGTSLLGAARQPLDAEAAFDESPDPATNPFLVSEAATAPSSTAGSQAGERTPAPPLPLRDLVTPQAAASRSASLAQAGPGSAPPSRAASFAQATPGSASQVAAAPLTAEAEEAAFPGAATPTANGAAAAAAAAAAAGGSASAHSQAIEVFVRELRALAALEASVYLVRSGKARGVRASSNARNAHAPARRLARTTISLGPEEGIIFGLRAVRAVEAAADGCGDVAGQAYWWSNCIQLRWMLWAMCRGGEAEGADDSEEFDWVMQVLVPPLRELEAHVFQQLFQRLWGGVLAEGARADGLPGSQPKQWIIRPSREEEAVQRWIDALQMVHRALLPASSCVTPGHVTMLKHKCLTAVMRRLDAALLDRLVGGGSDAFAPGWRGAARGGAGAELPLDARMLPFAPDAPLSFGVGVNLKMAATRWTNWAADIGLRNDKGSPEEGYMLFPKLRATADLLMMPKEGLTDRSIRGEVVPGLPLRVICELLSRFQPDELASDPLPPGLLEALQNETPPSEEGPSPISQGLADYEPPSEAALLADGLIEPVSLEMDAESEDELESLIEMYDPDRQGHTTERFNLLRELWASAR